LLDEHHDQSQLADLYRAADICVVSSLHDGMNLVAKEFVAARGDEQGVLVLSTFAGASRELAEALLVNPFDTANMGEVFFQALTMPADEARERMRRLRETVRTNNVFRWAGSMLLDAARIRNRVPSALSPGQNITGERMRIA
jgi:trehalose-6-phosphate synthase